MDATGAKLGITVKHPPTSQRKRPNQNLIVWTRNWTASRRAAPCPLPPPPAPVIRRSPDPGTTVHWPAGRCCLGSHAPFKCLSQSDSLAPSQDARHPRNTVTRVHIFLKGKHETDGASNWAVEEPGGSGLRFSGRVMRYGQTEKVEPISDS